MAILPIPPSSVAFIDPITGGVSIQWQNFFQSLQTITGGFAPLDARYWVSTSNGDLTNETNIGSLATGYLKIVTAAGVATPSTTTSIPGTDITGTALTTANDTNMTLTAGGSAATALLRAASLTLAWSGTLAHGRGGTDVTSPGSSGNVLTSNGTNWTSAAPASAGTVTSVAMTVPGGFSISGSPITASGTLALAANGTSGGVPYYSGATTMASSAALTAHGVVIGGGAATAPTSTSAGTSGQVLTSNGAAADPTFQTASGGSVVTLLKSGQGTSTAAGATTVDSVAISGLTAADTIYVYYSIYSVTAATAAVVLYSVTDSAVLLDLSAGASIAGGNFIFGQGQLQQAVSASTTVAAVAQAINQGLTRKDSLGFPTVTTAWTGSWTLGLRHGGVTATGTFKYVWSVFKMAGQ